MTPSEMAGQIDSIHTAGDVVLGPGSFSANGTYSAIDDSLDGYSSIVVNVSGGGSGSYNETQNDNVIDQVVEVTQ